MTIEEHYKENFSKLVKRYTRAAGTVWDAEDVVQTAYERALRYHTEEILDLDAWIGNIIKTCLIDHLNETKGIYFEEMEEFDHEAVSTINTLEFSKTLDKLISMENEDHQPILELHFKKGYSALDIYRHNKHSYPNTRKIIQRFRDRLREEFASV